MQILQIESLEESKNDLEKYIDKISSFDINEPLLVIMDSNWWATYIAEFLSRIIPRFKYDIEVYTASSCALTLFDKIAQGAMTIHISDECWAVAHFSCHSVWIKDWVPRWQNERYKIENRNKEEHIPSVLNAKQIEEFKKWNDVYILAKDMIKHYTK